jgi:murein DD-endopeptidase MepM/ murein hydrolase activator NlpD
MPRMHPTTRLLTILATLGIATTAVAPALAAKDGQLVDGRFGVARVVDWATETKAKQRAVAGPFVPVVGDPDYGTAENAFGAARSGHVHAGQDIFAAPGTPLVAVTGGVIAETGSDAGQGNYVYLYDAKRERTYVYMHMIEPAEVDTGAEVSAGERLGGVGCTGSCWGEHLHFEIRDGRGIAGEAHDPMPELADWRQLERPR